MIEFQIQFLKLAHFGLTFQVEVAEVSKFDYSGLTFQAEVARVIEF